MPGTMRVATSLDGRHLAALRGGELALFATEPGEVIARAAAPAGASLAFLDDLLLVHAVDGGQTWITLHALTDLGAIARLELDGPSRLDATTRQHALLDRAGGAVVVNCAAANPSAQALRVAIGLDRAVGLAGAQVLAWSRRGPEIWDAGSGRPVARA